MDAFLMHDIAEPFPVLTCPLDVHVENSLLLQSKLLGNAASIVGSEPIPDRHVYPVDECPAIPVCRPVLCRSCQQDAHCHRVASPDNICVYSPPTHAKKVINLEALLNRAPVTVNVDAHLLFVGVFIKYPAEGLHGADL